MRLCKIIFPALVVMIVGAHPRVRPFIILNDFAGGHMGPPLRRITETWVAGAQHAAPLHSDEIVVSVLSLFHPKNAIVRFKSATQVALETSQGIRRVDSPVFSISIENGALAVNGVSAKKMAGPATPGEFEVEIPNRIIRKYFGAPAIQLSADKKELVILITVPIEQLVAAAVYAEMGEEAPVEAKRSLAVAVRSFSLAGRGRHGNEGYDLCDTTHCFVFRGLENRQAIAETRNSLKATQGAFISYNDKPVQAFFHATCGGTTRTPEEVWGNSVEFPYRRVACPYCKNSLHYRWSSYVKNADLAGSLSIPDGVAWQIKMIGEDRIAIESPGSNRLLKREEFRTMVGRELGWNILYSPWFSMKAVDNGHIFNGRGFGHGVGLCEGGAMEMARRGNRWPAIIRYYFPGARIERAYPGSH